MLTTIKRVAIFSLIFFTLLKGTAYSTENSRKHSELPARIKQIKTVMIIPEVKIYEILAGGVKEYREEWSSKGKDNMLNAVSEILKGKRIESKTVLDDQALAEEFQDMQALYKRVSSSIRLHTFNNPNLFPDKLQQFDYSVGSMDKIMNDLNVDAILLVDATDEISSGGRVALATAGIIAGAIIGIVPIPRSGIHVVSMGLVDRSGYVIWFNVQYGGQDMREPEGAAQTAAGILSDLPASIQ